MPWISILVIVLCGWGVWRCFMLGRRSADESTGASVCGDRVGGRDGGKVSTVALGIKGAVNSMLEIINIQLPSLPDLAVMLPVVVSGLWAVKLTLDIGFSIWDRWKGKAES